MRTQVLSGLQVLRRTAVFLEGEVNVPAKIGPINRHVEALKGIVVQLTSLAEEQAVTERGYRDAAHRAGELARSLVVEFVRPVIRTGKLLFPVESPLRTTLKTPDADAAYEELIASAVATADRVEEHKAKYVEAGFAEDFVDKLRAAIDELRQALEEKAVFFGRRTRATAGLVGQFARGREMVRILDGMVASRLKGTDRFPQWKSLSRFARRKGEEVPVVEDAPVVTVPAPAPAVNDGAASAVHHAA